MKIHAKKKAYRKECKEMAKAGKINDSNGKWISRPSGGNSMTRDYYPQGK